MVKNFALAAILGLFAVTTAFAAGATTEQKDSATTATDADKKEEDKKTEDKK